MITGIDEWSDGEWFDHRSHTAASMCEAAEHTVSRNTPSWFHVFRIGALTVFLLQLVADILLALIYLSPASQPWTNVEALNHHVVLGWFVRAIYGWGCTFMLAIVPIPNLRPAGRTSARDAPRDTLLLAGGQKPPLRRRQSDHNP